MSIYRFGWLEGFDRLGLAGDHRWDPFTPLFNGERRAHAWNPVAIRTSKGRERVVDFPYLDTHVPVFSERAWNVLKPLIEPSVEALPLLVAGGPYYAINVLDVIDCLDEKRSALEHYKDGEIATINRYAFKQGTVEGKAIFKVAGWWMSLVFVSEEFKQEVERHKLKGAMFRLEAE